jgi:hypothetical protein
MSNPIAITNGVVHFAYKYQTSGACEINFFE